MTRCNLIQDMVHIKKVEIFGFKSFGFRNTVVDFRPGLVSISGPNGSGKSNILDAIIFASGEMRPKVMRVDKIRSLIHDVSSSGGGSRMARVSVHFENSDRKIPFDSDSVEITRELSPDGGLHLQLVCALTNLTDTFFCNCKYSACLLVGSHRICKLFI